MKLFSRLKTLYAREEGVALIEFAFALPLLLIIFLGVVEITNFVYAGQKAQSAAENMVNIINLQNNVSTPQLESISQMLPQIARPLPVNEGEYKVIVTAMQRDLGDDFAYVRWQKAFGNDGAGSSQFSYSEAGSKESNEVTVDGFAFIEGDQILIVEVYMRYSLLIGGDLIGELFGLHDGDFLYHMTPPSRPRTGSFQFHPDDLV